MRAARAFSALTVALTLGCLLQLARAEPSSTGLFARYRVKHGERAEELVLVRTESHVEHRFVERGTRELWLRDARGEFEHLKLYPRAQRAVHYTPGDLRTIEASPSWDELASLVSTRERSALKAVRERREAGRLVSVLRGELRTRPAELLWLREAALPAKLTMGRGLHKVELELLELSPCSADKCSAQVDGAIRVLEFADLGDMEYDPFVRSFLAREGHGHEHPLR